MFKRCRWTARSASDRRAQIPVVRRAHGGGGIDYPPELTRKVSELGLWISFNYWAAWCCMRCSRLFKQFKRPSEKYQRCLQWCLQHFRIFQDNFRITSDYDRDDHMIPHFLLGSLHLIPWHLAHDPAQVWLGAVQGLNRHTAIWAEPAEKQAAHVECFPLRSLRQWQGFWLLDVVGKAQRFQRMMWFHHSIQDKTAKKTPRLSTNRTLNWKPGDKVSNLKLIIDDIYSLNGLNDIFILPSDLFHPAWV